MSGFDFNRLTERVGLRVAWSPDYPEIMDGELMAASPSWWRRNYPSTRDAIADCYPALVDFYAPWP